MENKKYILLTIVLFFLTGVISCSKNPTSSTIKVSLTGSPDSGDMPLNVQFTANAQDNDGSIVKYEWDLDGDGNYETTTTINTLHWLYTDESHFP